MSTFLFDKVIFGPVRSRRLGISLGINVMKPTAKLCNFDCIYCECGWNGDNPGGSFNTVDEISQALELKLQEMEAEGQLPDVITFAGNGEPTMHPQFEAVIDSTIAIRDRICPQCKIAVLSNATMIDRPAVVAALKRIDRSILKLDSAFDQTAAIINQPNKPRTQRQTIELMKQFDGRMIVQTMFIRGEYKGRKFDNTTEEEVEAWVTAIAEIRPAEVMLYSIDRDTPASGLEKVSREEMLAIAEKIEKLGIKTSVA